MPRDYHLGAPSSTGCRTDGESLEELCQPIGTKDPAGCRDPKAATATTMGLG